MNQNLSDAINPLSEHLESRKTIRRQNSLLGYLMAFALGFVICFVFINNYSAPRIKEDKTEDY